MKNENCKMQKSKFISHLLESAYSLLKSPKLRKKLWGLFFIFQFAFCIFLLGVCPLHATTILKLSLEEMCQKANGVFLGRCISTESRWNAEKTKIYTYITIQLDRILKCQEKGIKENSKIVIKQLGGIVGNIGMKVSGVAYFQPSEEVLVFLRKDSLGDYQILGMSQGKYSISQDPGTKKKFLNRDLGGVNLIDEKSLSQGSMKSMLKSPEEEILYLDDFIKRLQEILKDQQVP